MHLLEKYGNTGQSLSILKNGIRFSRLAYSAAENDLRVGGKFTSTMAAKMAA